ncbi:hypothetical protein A2U01_0056270, partial [Trifolium medium]|nr:hypothetical protein [Trifolium medium]
GWSGIALSGVGIEFVSIWSLLAMGDESLVSSKESVTEGEVEV